MYLKIYVVYNKIKITFVNKYHDMLENILMININYKKCNNKNRL